MKEPHMIKLKCLKCNSFFELSGNLSCPNCGGILIVEHKDELNDRINFNIGTSSMWDFQDWLPPVSKENIVTLGEGATPLKKSLRLGDNINIENLFFKDETRNPTGSFKDRPISVCMSMAKEFGCKSIVISSSGNGAASAAAYASLAGLECLIFVPETTPENKIAQAVTYGGEVIKVRGHFSNAYRTALEVGKEDGRMNITTTFLNPYGLEGDKTIAYEIFFQLQAVPDYVVIPVGAGPILYGVYKGFKELMKMGLINSIPRLIAIQAEGCSPIADAFVNNRKVESCRNTQTIASAISDPLVGYEDDGNITISAIRATDGFVVKVSDEEILKSGIELASQEGLYVEPSSASTIAGLKKISDNSRIMADSNVVCILTGHGLKDPISYVHDRKFKTISDINDLNLNLY